MSVSKVHGRFGNVKATIVYNQADVTKSTVTATIGVDTVDTGVDARNTHLKSADFFDVAKLPTATFTSTSVAKNGSHLTVTGNLTLHGITKPVVLDVEGPNGAMTDPKGQVHTGFSATTTSTAPPSASAPSFPPSCWATRSRSTSSWKPSSSKPALVQARGLRSQPQTRLAASSR